MSSVAIEDAGSVVPETYYFAGSKLSGDGDFDRTQPFPIYRWSVLDWLPKNQFGAWLGQIVSLPNLLCMAFKLYARYGYRYIEWGHGYDALALFILRYFLPVKCIIYLHGHDLICTLNNFLLRWIFHKTLRRIHGVVCNSNFTQEYLQKHLSYSLKTYVINPCVRPEKFGQAAQKNNWEILRQEIRQQFAIAESAIFVLTVGRLIRRKGFDRAIRLLPQLLNEGIDIHYVICGRGPQQSELQSLIQKLAISDRVHFAGYVPDHHLAGYYAACDIFTMLTYFDSNVDSIEGFGIVYAEAGFFGKPVLASDVGGVRDAVHHNQNGLLVHSQDSSEALQALRRLCLNRELRERLGEQGRMLAKRQTSFELISKNGR